jgi:hypothetical protein
MEIEFLILADYVEALNNKLYLMGGGWNQIVAPSFPVNHRMGIAISILLDEAEAPAHFPLRLAILDVMAERPVIPEIAIDVAVQLAEPGVKPRAVVAMNTQFPLPGAGHYRVVATAAPNVRRETYFDARLVAPLQ